MNIFSIRNSKTSALRRALPALASIIFLATAAVAQQDGATSNTARVMLWNGVDLNGWKFVFEDPAIDPATVWSVADGVLKLDAKAAKGYLYLPESRSNYRLHAEWRWPADAAPKSNSGILLHIQGPDKIWPACYQFQLKTGDAGQMIGMELDIPAAPEVNAQKRAPRRAAPSEKPHGAWNSCEIHCRTGEIEVFVNGVRQNKIEQLPASAGAIGLQLEGFPIEFENIWLEQL